MYALAIITIAKIKYDEMHVRNLSQCQAHSGHSQSCNTNSTTINLPILGYKYHRVQGTNMKSHIGRNAREYMAGIRQGFTEVKF